MRAAKTAFEAMEESSSLDDYHQALLDVFERCHIQYQLLDDGHYTCFRAIDVRLIEEQTQRAEEQSFSSLNLPGELVIAIGQEQINANFYRHFSDSSGSGDAEEKRS